MRRISARAWICLALATTAVSARADLVADYTSIALQGDLRGARALFDAVPDGEKTASERELEAKFAARFERRDEALPQPEASPFVREVLGIYRDYWTKSLMGELDAERGESYLLRRLRAALAAKGITKSLDDEAVLGRLEREIEAEGLHFLGGVTRPWFELMLWKTQERRVYDCELTDASQKVEVEFLGDFIAWGWAHHATFGRAYSGGWATSEKLFCLRDDYELDSEKFKVGYIQHEGRHFADYKIFPKLEQIDLEYRAKLTELAFAEESLRDLIRAFAESAALNPDAPHSYANACVVRDLSTVLFGEASDDGTDGRWASATNAEIHGAARTLLEKNTAALREAGAKKTRGVVRPAAGP